MLGQSKAKVSQYNHENDPAHIGK